ncbi:MAG: UDP-N-acetylmuramoyl-L-alanine--D-glutamate ligase, partial [Alphaproteobacteria bacterium]|nr:UDP-N-acetylmuramoyl-L-alanine--D-glutamate ligase [Alphaproteobacteria bacterium]
IAAKKKIFATQQPGDRAIIAIDDDDTRALYSELSSRKDGPRVQTVSADTPLPDGITLDGIVSLRGWHNTQNAAVAIAAAMACGVDTKTIQNALRTFPGLPHRMEQVAEMGGVRFVNDSKATNADSTARALVCFDDIYWILGGEPKEGGIASLAPHFSRIHKAYVIGQAQASFPEVLKGKVEYDLCGDLATAFADASRDALKAGQGVVLLSPACASFDQWPNFEVRGDAFRALSHSLQEQMGKKQCSA